MRRVRSTASLTMSRYSSGVTLRPTSPVKFSRTTCRSHFAICHTAVAAISRNGRKNSEFEEAATEEGIHEAHVGRRLAPRRGLAGNGAGKRGEKRQCIVEHVGHHGEDEPEQWGDNAQPWLTDLERQPKKSSEDCGEHRVCAEPEQRKSGAELEPKRSLSELDVVLGHV